MNKNEYLNKAESEIGSNDLEAICIHCYNQAIRNGDKENAEWFGERFIRCVNNRWIDTYVKPTGMLMKRRK